VSCKNALCGNLTIFREDLCGIGPLNSYLKFSFDVAFGEPQALEAGRANAPPHGE
jgi:hypothetical protein